jgi:hypothetical protein
MTDNQQLDTLYRSAAYMGLLGRVAARLGTGLADDFPDILYTYDKRKLDCAGLSTADLMATVLTNAPEVEVFAALKLADLANENSGGEYPSGKEPDDDERPRVIDILPSYRNLLLPYLIEYTLLERDGDIAGYLKCARIPHAKVYLAQLRRWHTAAQG